MENIYSIMNVILPFEWLEMSFMKNALLAVIVACPLFGILGTSVVSNKMSFFSDAIGHSALTGIAIGVLIGIREPVISMILFALILGFIIITVKVKGKSSADTVIGVFSSTSVALGIVLLSAGGNFSKYQKYLIGDILSIKPYEILMLLGAFLVFEIHLNNNQLPLIVHSSTLLDHHNPPVLFYMHPRNLILFHLLLFFQEFLLITHIQLASHFFLHYI